MRRLGLCAAALLAGAACLWLGLATLKEGRALGRAEAALAAPVPPESLPAGSGAVTRLLGTGDERAAGEAALAYLRTRAGVSPAAATRAAADAESQLLPLADSGPAARRSWAATLIGVLEYERAALDRANAKQHVAQSLGALRAAIAADPGNEDAKADLELLLSRRQQQRTQKQKPSGHRKPRARPTATSSAAGTGW